MNKKLAVSVLIGLVLGAIVGYVARYLVYERFRQISTVKVEMERMEIRSDLLAHQLWTMTNRTYDYPQVILYFETWGPLMNTGYSAYNGIVNVTISLNGEFAENFIVSQEKRETAMVWKKYGTFADGNITVQIENILDDWLTFRYRLYLLS